jgi:DNA-binding transcriptional LysR family regulator
LLKWCTEPRGVDIHFKSRTSISTEYLNTPGLGIGILPAYIVGDALRVGRLVPLLRQFQVLPESAIYLVYLPNRSLPSRVRALIDVLAAWFGPVPSWEVGWR